MYAIRSYYGLRPTQRGCEPVLEDFHLDDVAGRAFVVGPHMPLFESHAIEHLDGLAVKAVRQFLGIGKGAADALDHSAFAAYVVSYNFV